MYPLSIKNIQGKSLKTDRVSNGLAKAPDGRMCFKGWNIPSKLPRGIEVPKTLTEEICKFEKIPDTIQKFLVVTIGTATATWVEWYTNKNNGKEMQDYTTAKMFVRQVVGGLSGVSIRYFIEKNFEPLYGIYDKKKWFSNKVEKRYKNNPLLKVPKKDYTQAAEKLVFNNAEKGFIKSSGQVIACTAGILSIIFIDLPIINKLTDYIINKYLPGNSEKKLTNNNSKANNPTSGGKK